MFVPLHWASVLLDCIDSDLDKVNQNIYNKITTLAKDLVKTGKEIENAITVFRL